LTLSDSRVANRLRGDERRHACCVVELVSYHYKFLRVQSETTSHLNHALLVCVKLTLVLLERDANIGDIDALAFALLEQISHLVSHLHRSQHARRQVLRVSLLRRFPILRHPIHAFGVTERVRVAREIEIVIQIVNADAILLRQGDFVLQPLLDSLRRGNRGGDGDGTQGEERGDATACGDLGDFRSRAGNGDVSSRLRSDKSTASRQSLREIRSNQESRDVEPGGRGFSRAA